MASHPFDFDDDPGKMVSSPRDFDRMYRNDWDDRDDIRRRRDSRDDAIKYGLMMLYSMKPRSIEDDVPSGLTALQKLSATNELRYRDDDHPISQAIRAIEGVLRSSENFKHDASSARHNAAMAEHVRNQILEYSKTIVSVPFSEETEAWAKDQMPDRYKIVKDGNRTHFIFDDMQSAALFKLQWG